MSETTIVDRRKNAKNKSVGARQKFIKRAKGSIKKSIDEAIQKKDIADISDGMTGDKISIPSKGISEPTFGHSRKNPGSTVLPGNKEFIVGDELKKPEDGAGGGGTEGSPDGEGEDEFTFTLTRDEFLDFFFDDLELPDMVKTQLKEVETFTKARAGYTVSGSPNNLDLVRTMRNSLGRKAALESPYVKRIKAIEEELKDDDNTEERIEELLVELKEQKDAKNRIPFIDDIDVRYRSYTNNPNPNTKAVMFCLMDVSASMGEHEKTMSKKFFVLLHMFLTKKYEKIDVVFIRHHSKAKECDEEEFFYSKESGGTVVSSCLQLAHEIIQDRYNASSWNIYMAQASDGDNFGYDSAPTREIMNAKIMPYVQYFSYVQIARNIPMGDPYALMAMAAAGYDGKKQLWKDYEPIDGEWENFSMKEIKNAKDIFPVFKELFKKKD